VAELIWLIISSNGGVLKTVGIHKECGSWRLVCW